LEVLPTDPFEIQILTSASDTDLSMPLPTLPRH
jgi:hypothetical protein